MAARKKIKKKKISFLSRIVLVINAIAIIALLISYTAPYVNPTKFVIPAFFGIAYPYLASLNLVFIIFWIINNKLYFLWSMIAILSGWYHIANHIQFNRPVDISKVEYDFKVMTYNVRAFDFYDWKHDDESLGLMLESIEDEAPDVVCMQEFYNNRKKNNMKHKIQAIHGLKHSYADFFFTRKGEHEFGIATFSSRKIIDKNSLSIDGSDRCFGIYTDIVTGKDTLRVYNIHLASYKFADEDYSFVSEISQGGKSNAELKEGSLKIIRKLARAYQRRAIEARALREHLRHCTYKVVICGDFNDTPVSYTYRTIRKGMEDSFRKSGQGIGKTYSGILPSFRIDYILHSGEMESMNYKVINNAVSDHYPLSCYILANPPDDKK